MSGPQTPQYPMPGWQGAGDELPRPSKGNRKVLLIIGGVAALVVLLIVAAVVLALVYTPWRPHSGPTTKSFALDHGVTVTIDVPSDWRAFDADANGRKKVVLLPAGAGTPEAAEAALEDLRDGRSPESVHILDVIAREPGYCTPGVPAGRWQDTRSSGADGDLSVATVMNVQQRFGDAACVVLRGWDYAPDQPITEAGDLAQRLTDDGALTVTTS